MLNIIVSLVSGAVLALAFPGANQHWLAWFALAPLFYFTHKSGWKLASACGFAFGLGFFGVLLYWIGIFGTLPLIALVIEQSAYIAAFVIAVKLIGGKAGLRGRLLLLPALWVVFEWVRSLGMLGFTWGDLGYSQYKVLPVIQVASIAGVWGVSFILALSNSALANLAISWNTDRRAGLKQIGVSAVVVILVISYGLVSISRPIDRSGKRVRAAVVQGGYNSDLDGGTVTSREIWRTYINKTLSVSGTADLIVWPESAVPGEMGSNPSTQYGVKLLAKLTKANLLVGGWDVDDRERYYNSAFLVDSSGIIGKYAKVHLVPFGEYVPGSFKRAMPLLKQFRVVENDTTPGPGFQPVDTGGYKVGTAICFESIFPPITRRLTQHGADLLCVITNDSWFGDTAAPEQHMAMSVLRAVENRRYLVRGAATGISCIVDPKGRILSESGICEANVVEGTVWTEKARTPYTRFGDWVIWMSMVVVLMVLFTSLFRAKKVASCVEEEQSPNE